MIVLGCDHGGLAIKNAIAADLKARGVEYKDVGTYTEESVDYPVYAKAVCDEITSDAPSWASSAAERASG